MKSKTRKIVVNEITYHWLVRANVDGDGGDRLDIFLNKKKIYSDILRGFNIGPGLVYHLIDQACASSPT